MEPNQLPPKQVAYEKRFHGGGGCCFSGPPMWDDGDDGDPVLRDYNLFYKCETLKQWLPVPPGHSVDEAGDSDKDNIMAAY